MRVSFICVEISVNFGLRKKKSYCNMDLDSDDENVIDEDYYTFLNVAKEVN